MFPSTIRRRARTLLVGLALVIASCGAPASANEPDAPAAPVDAACYADHVVSGALPAQPPPVYCQLTDQPSDTSIAGPNSWVDDFDHGLALATMLGTNYLTFGPFGDVHEGATWRGGSKADHWMVDLTPDDAGTTGGTMIRPNQSFRFDDDGTFVAEADFAAAHPDYGNNAWGEVIITTAPVAQYRHGALYGYEAFAGHHALGCRLQPSREPVCALMDDDFDASGVPIRTWEISFFQHEGTSVFGGFPGADAPWRACEPGQGDLACRDRFSLRLTRDSLALDVNGTPYFAQAGLPELPAELQSQDLYVYYASMFSRHPGQTLRYHWDRLAVNPPDAPTMPPADPPTSTPPAPPITAPPITAPPITAPPLVPPPVAEPPATCPPLNPSPGPEA